MDYPPARPTPKDRDPPQDVAPPRTARWRSGVRPPRRSAGHDAQGTVEKIATAPLAAQALPAPTAPAMPSTRPLETQAARDRSALRPSRHRPGPPSATAAVHQENMCSKNPPPRLFTNSIRSTSRRPSDRITSNTCHAGRRVGHTAGHDNLPTCFDAIQQTFKRRVAANTCCRPVRENRIETNAQRDRDAHYDPNDATRYRLCSRRS